MNKLLTLLALSILISCSKYSVTINQRNPADIAFKSKRSTTYFWGIINKPHSIIDTSCGTAGLAEVKVISHPGYSFLNIATLGIIQVIKIEWKCQKQAPIVGY